MTLADSSRPTDLRAAESHQSCRRLGAATLLREGSKSRPSCTNAGKCKWARTYCACDTFKLAGDAPCPVHACACACALCAQVPVVNVRYRSLISPFASSASPSCCALTCLCPFGQQTLQGVTRTTLVHFASRKRNHLFRLPIMAIPTLSQLTAQHPLRATLHSLPDTPHTSS